MSAPLCPTCQHVHCARDVVAVGRFDGLRGYRNGVTADLHPTRTAAEAALCAARAPIHVCDTGHFDRTLCPEPCGAMHSFCATCDVRQDPCAHDEPATPTTNPAAAATRAELTAEQED